MKWWFYNEHVFPSTLCIFAALSCAWFILFQRPGTTWCVDVASFVAILGISLNFFYFLWWLALDFACVNLSLINKEAIV